MNRVPAAGGPIARHPAGPGPTRSSSHIAPGVAWTAATALAVTFTLVARPACAADPGPDTTTWRFEAGVSSDFTNELFYEDAFVDSVSLGRRLVSTPEGRAAGLVAVNWTGTRGLRATQYAMHSEVTMGDKLQRGAANLTWRAPLAGDWVLRVAPAVEYRRDRTFDRDLDELRASTNLRVRHDGLAGPAAEIGLRGDLLRTHGTGADFLPDRNTGQVTLALGSGAFAASEWWLGYALGVRTFPDSVERDHVEHGFDGRWRRASGNATVAFDATGLRRVTRLEAPTSRDNFWDGQAGADLDLRAGLSWVWRLRIEGEAIHYDREDSTLYFDYQILRAGLSPRLELGAWTVAAGPRVEALFSRVGPQEAYREVGAAVDVEYIASAFLTFSPAAGRRVYRAEASDDPFAITAVHSDYTYYELNLLADQPVGGGVRLRALATGRYEQHRESADDARSLYFSLDVRRLF